MLVLFIFADKFDLSDFMVGPKSSKSGIVNKFSSLTCPVPTSSSSSTSSSTEVESSLHKAKCGDSLKAASAESKPSANSASHLQASVEKTKSISTSQKSSQVKQMLPSIGYPVSHSKCNMKAS